MSLTNHQQEILNKSLDILTFGDRLLIKGSAGVGKTYMVNELIKQLAKHLPSYKKIYCSAPTNKAVAVVKGKVDSRDNLEFVTTHSALKLKRNINNKTGDVTFKPWFNENYPPLKGVGLFIIDEASMLNKELLEFIEEYATMFKAKVIFIGDNKQLNPVGEEESPVFIAGYPEVELTEIIRQGDGNPIITLSRDLSLVNNVANQVSDDTTGYLFSNNKAKVIHELAEVNGTDEIKYLAWTNRDVDSINKMVRQEIYGNPKKIEVGETLVFNAPYGETYFTNEEIKVETVHIKEAVFSFMFNKQGKVQPINDEEPLFKEQKFKYYSINSHDDGKGNIIDNIIVIHEDSEKDYDNVLKVLRNRCKGYYVNWGDFYKFTEQFADLKYNHAITVHKSQGSTYKNAIVNLKNLKMNKNQKEKQRLLYTAITRASDLLILYNY